MSGNSGFSPIRCTVHVSMLPYAYTNNDVAKLFEPCGRIAQYDWFLSFYHSVTILKDRKTRESKGVAWIQFVELYLFSLFIYRRESAEKAIEELNGKKVDVSYW